MLRNEGDRLARVVVCTPMVEYLNVDDLKAHNITQRADKDLAIRQHDALKSTIARFGSQVIDVPELGGHPNSVFTRDTALSTPNGYIRLRLGLDTRLGEGEWMSQVLDGIGEPCVGEISVPGTVEGGDVVLAGSVAFVGRSVRTDAEGVTQLGALLSDMDYEMRVVHLPDHVLHLDKAMMVVGPDRILFCSDLVPRDCLGGFDLIEIPYGGRVTANIICLGDGEVIVERSNREVIERLDALGLVVHALDLSEFVKGTGGPNCLIMPVERK